MAETFSLAKSRTARNNLTATQQMKITKLYTDLTVKMKVDIAKLDPNDTGDSFRIARLKGLTRKMKAELATISGDVKGIIKDTATQVAQAVADDGKSWLDKIGMPPKKINGAYQNIPTDIVANLLDGKVYQKDWTLSKALWADVQRKQKDINAIVAEGIAMNKSSLDIALDLEKYVDPKAKKDWEWSKVYPGTATKIDYNAQRLARTLTSHAYQQSLVATVEDNPWVDMLMWHSSNAVHGRVCELCKERDGKEYEKGSLPLDHPNGLCTFTAVVSKSLDDISNEIADWVSGTPNKTLDKFSREVTKK